MLESLSALPGWRGGICAQSTGRKKKTTEAESRSTE
jgi:hypothetical protein